MKRLILASTSPRRKELMDSTGLPYEHEASDYEEDMTKPLAPVELVKELSGGKAQDVADKHKDEDVVVIGADTIVVFNDKRLGKPKSQEHAREMLLELRSQTVQILSGFTLIDCATGKTVSGTKASDVYFRNFTDEEMGWYIATGDPLDKAGAFAVQTAGVLLIEKVDGDISNCMGLPLAEVLNGLREFGVDLW